MMMVEEVGITPHPGCERLSVSHSHCDPKTRGVINRGKNKNILVTEYAAIIFFTVNIIYTVYVCEPELQFSWVGRRED